jgi:hypothetical protein
MAAGNLNMTNGSSVANITNVVVGQSMRANAISTNQISTNNINVNTINNAPYPPGGGGGIPSTLNASTINFNGGLNNVGSAPIITNQITTNNINVNTINNAPYPPGGGGGSIPSTLNASTLNVNGGQIVTNGGLTISGGGTITGVGKWRYRMANVASAVSFEQAAGNNDSIILDLNSDKTTRFYSTLLVRDSTWPSPQPSGASIRTYDTSDPAPYGSVITSNVSTLLINSQFATLSTISTSTLNVNGGQTITNAPLTFFDTALNRTNGNIIANSGTLQIAIPEVGSPGGSAFTITAGSTLASTLMFLAPTGRVRFTSSMTVRDPVPVGTTSQAYITTYTVGSEAPAGSVITSNVSSLTGNIAQLAVSSINGLVYPIPTPPAAPVGSITIWAGGSDNGAVQTFNVPAGWLLCDGAEYQRSVYSDLFNVIGTKYALNKPSTGLNFYVPDLTFAVPMGTPYRNYTSTIFSPSRFQVYVQSWLSDFSPPATPSSKTWKINQTVGGTLNFGTMFPASGIPLPGFPTLYVSQIISYDGYQGYIVVKSVNGAAIPDIPAGNQIIVQGDGTVPQDASGTYLYTLGSYGVDSGYPQVTHNQKAAEVASHTHSYNRYGLFGSTGLANGTFDPSKSSAFQDTASNQLSTISTVGATNIGTYTAPNFLNMAYLIKF